MPTVEEILWITSNGAFPKFGQRENLTNRQRRQLRDAMILETHAREGRDILVSNDARAFGKPGSTLRRDLETLCSTRIMTDDEFVAYCDQLRQSPKSKFKK